MSQEIGSGHPAHNVDGYALTSICRVDSQIFQWRHNFFIQINVLAACFQNTGGFALYWLLANAKNGCLWRPDAYKVYPIGRQSHANCARVAAIRMQHE